MEVCGVKFKDIGKTYYFSVNGIDVKLNDYVVVDTEKGEQYAKVTDIDIEKKKNVDMSKMKNVLRLASTQDSKNYMNNLKEAAEALEYVKKESTKQNLDMHFVDASYTLDKKQLIFNFIADSRVDFRDFVKDVASKYKTRIELHQMGVRDKAKEISGLGQCGRELCCSKFLNGIDTISINMAKNQNIALNPTKINGICGRLMCCLAYEDDVYTEHRRQCPKINEKVKTTDGEGRVTSLDVLNKKYTVDINGESHTYEVE